MFKVIEVRNLFDPNIIKRDVVRDKDGNPINFPETSEEEVLTPEEILEPLPPLPDKTFIDILED